MDPTHLSWHDHDVSRSDREALCGHRGCVVWFTGLSGSGKSTIANLVDRRLFTRGIHTFLLDGDNVRHGLNASPAIRAAEFGEAHAARFGLGFSQPDRSENVRRVAAVAQLFCCAGMVTLAAFVSPYRRDRLAARRAIETAGQVGDFIEVFVDAPIEVCEARDPKGLYHKARQGQLKDFTGIDDAYEPPEAPELRLDAAAHRADQLADAVVAYLQEAEKIPRG